MRVGTLEIQIMAGLARLQKDMNDAQRMVGGAMGNVERSVASAKRAMQTLGVGLPLAAITDQVRRMSDQYTKLDAQIRLATKSQAAYAQGMSDIRRISTIAQADISATSMLYTRLINTMEGTGVSQQKLATVTETISFGLKAYGATTQEAASAALQLSQAMGANRLGGEEFRAVMEAMPNVMKVLADSMGVPLGQLRQLSIDGKITADEMVKAFGNPAVAAQFKALAMSTQTVTGAWQVARNELMLLVGEFSKSSGLTSSAIAAFNAFGAVFRFIADNMDLLVRALGAYTAVMVGKFVVGVVQARIEQMALNAAHAEALAVNTAMAQSEASLAAAKAGTAAATAATTVSLLRNTLATVEARTATLANVVAENEATLAQLNHAKAAGMLSGHYYMVRKIEAELVVVTQALAVATTELNVATERQTRLQAALILEDKALTKARGELALATAAVTRAEKLQEAGSIGIMGRIKGLAGRAGWIGMALFGAWTVYDFLNNMQAVADGADKLKNKFEGMTLAEVQMARQRELIRQIGMRGMLQDDAAIQNSQDMIRAYDQQIAKMVELQNAETNRTTARTVALTGDAAVMQARFDALAKELGVTLTQAEYEAKVRDLYGQGAKAAKAYAAEQRALAAERKRAGAEGVSIVKEQIRDAAATDSETASLVKQIEAIKLETESIGKTKAEIDLLQAARFDHETQIMRETLATLDAANACTAESGALRDAIKAREQYKKAQTDQSARHKAQEQIAAEKNAQKDLWDSIDRTAHDTFVSILDGGKNAATRLKDAFKNIFYDWLYQMTIKKWIVNMSGQVSMSGTGSAIGGLPGGGFGNITSFLPNSITDKFGSMFGNISSAMNSLGGLAAIVTIGSKIGSMIAGDKKFMGMGGDIMGGLFGGVGGGVFTRLFGSRTPTASTSDVTQTYDPTGRRISQSIGAFGGAGGASTLDAIAKSVTDLRTAFGVTGNNLRLFYGANTGKMGQSPNFLLAGGGFSTGPNETPLTQAAMEDASMRVIFAALKSSKLPKYLAEVFNSVDVKTASKEVIDSTLAFAQVLKQTRDALTETRTPLEILQHNVSAGAKALKTSSETFRKDFTAAIDAGITPEAFAKWTELGAIMDQLAAAEAQVASVRLSWQQKLDVLTGATTQQEIDRKTALAGVTDSATRSIMEQVFAEEDRIAALADAQRAADQLKSAWQSVTDSIFQEVARIRGLTATPSGTMEQFATLTAMARAGDQEAAKLLPGIARAVLDTAALTASSATDLARIQGQTAASLETTGSSLASKYGLTIPAFAAGGVHRGGLRMVGEKGPELEYTGPSTVFSNRDTRSMLDNSGVVASVDALRDELRAIGIAVSGSTQKTAKILDRWDGQGMPETREAA